VPAFVKLCREHLIAETFFYLAYLIVNRANHSDAQLIQSLQHGEEAAMAEIYSRYWKKLLAIAYNHLKDKALAEEVVQDVLINLWDRRADLHIHSLPDYLATAVKYTVLRALHNQKRKEEVAQNIFRIKQQYQVDEESIYARFLQEYINGEVEKLPEKCQLVFKYSRQQGMSTPQIAQKLNIAEKTVETHLTKALKFIRGSLRNAGLFLFSLLLLLTGR
jgi:RNA polymerase sigma-70 factor (ECF subfamily)